MKKALRPLSFVLAFVLIFSVFFVPSYAEDTILGGSLTYDLSSWESTNPDYSYIQTITSFSPKPIYDVVFEPMPLDGSSLGLRTGVFYDLNGLYAGDSYKLNFYLLSPSELNDFLDTDHFGSWYFDSFTKRNAVLYIGLGSVSNGNFTVADTGVIIDKNNYKDYFGKPTTLSFVMPNIVNPAVGIFYMDTVDSGNNTHIYIQDMVLLNKSDADDAETDGLLNSIINAIRDLGDFITDGFSNISDGISNLGDWLSDGFSSITDGLGDLEFNLLSGFENLLTRFGNLFLYLTWSDTPPDNPFETAGGPLDLVEGFFDDLFAYLENIKNDLVSVVDSVSSGVFVFETMVDRFPWLKGLCVFSLALIVVTRFIGL